MADKFNIELDESFLKKLYGLTDEFPPEAEEVTLSELKKQLLCIEELIKNQSTQEIVQDKKIPKSSNNANLISNRQNNNNEEDSNTPHILIIDDLGIITYQLSNILKKSNMRVTTSKEIYEAIEKYKRTNFDAIIMDLFIPTDREGFIMLNEFMKTNKTRGNKTIIGIISASSKKEHKQACAEKGAKFYVEKIDDWQNDVLQIIKELLK